MTARNATRKFIFDGAMPLSCALLVLGMTAVPLSSARAQEVGTLAYYNLPLQEKRDNYIAWKNFIEYESREPCQGYWPPPAGYVMIDCQVHRIAADAPPVEVTQVQETTVVQPPATTTVTEETHHLLPIVSSYTLYFDFDRANIRADQKDTLDRIAQEIEKYHPTQVTVAGHTDTAGPAKYNARLSEKRAKSVAAALTAEGVENQVIDKKAYGEEDLAVPTPNGSPNQENRRAVVDFRR